jgi:hypothetical protein
MSLLTSSTIIYQKGRGCCDQGARSLQRLAQEHQFGWAIFRNEQLAHLSPFISALFGLQHGSAAIEIAFTSQRSGNRQCPQSPKKALEDLCEYKSSSFSRARLAK